MVFVTEIHIEISIPKRGMQSDRLGLNWYLRKKQSHYKPGTE
jgi:hypothetical protein